MIARHNIPSIPARRFAAAGMAAFGLRSISRQLLRDVRGVVLPLMAISLPVLIGFASLGVEVGHWYLMQREMQGAADAAAISTAAQYIADYPTNPSSTTYQTVGRSYASTNGFTIPVSNVCLVTSSGDNCGTVRSLDSRAITCAIGSTTLFCVVVEITNTPSAMLLAAIPAMPTPPTLKVRAIVQATSNTTTTNGTDCVLALANATNAVQVSGNGDIKANCGISVDGGRDQNAGTPIAGGITFNGAHAQVNISSLVVASNSTNCPGSHCFLFSPSTSALPAANVLTNTATQDPYAAIVTSNFPTPPSGVQTGGVAITAGKQGAGYTNGTRTFTALVVPSRLLQNLLRQYRAARSLRSYQ
jgi:Flp pilus assembly protein TadG